MLINFGRKMHFKDECLFIWRDFFPPLKIASIKIYAFKNFIEFLLLLLLVVVCCSLSWRTWTGFLRSHIFHVEAIYSLICCSFISLREKCSRWFLLFIQPADSRFPFNTLIWRFLCTFWIFRTDSEREERIGNSKLALNKTKVNKLNKMN